MFVINRFRKVRKNLNKMLKESENRYLTNGIQQGLNKKIDAVHSIFDEMFSIHAVDEIFLSFNGGKDCTVLLDMVVNYMKNKQNLNDQKIRVIYIQPENPFEEIEAFVETCVTLYNLDIERKKGALKKVLESVCNESPNLKAVIMGCRRTDPYCQDLKTLQPTDPGWPALLRVNPLLQWTCKDIWDYIKERNVLYCSLYDDGYTSIGDKTNTKPNPYLKFVDSSTGVVRYRPAYELTDDTNERAGRL